MRPADRSVIGWAAAVALVVGSFAATDAGPQPVPDTRSVAKVTSQLQSLFGDEWDPRSDELRLPLVDRLLDAAATTDDMTARYVMLDHAAGQAAQCGDVTRVVKACDAIEAAFAVDPIAYRLDHLRTTQRRVRQAEPALALAVSLVSLTEKAIDLDRYSEAQAAAQIADRCARAARQVSLAATSRQLMTEARRLGNIYQRLAVHMETLDTTPDDGAARLAVGRFYAFTKDDWPRGLKLLAGCDDESLAALAAADLAAGDSAEQRLAIAQRWWVWPTGGDVEVARGRAAFWYEAALPQLDGLARLKAEQRITEYYQSLPAGKRASVKPGNVALATNGAKATAPRRPEELIDGNTTRYTGSTGFSHGSWPCEFVVELDRTYPLRQVRIKLWDGDTRRFKYIASVSADGKNWNVIADHSDKPSAGWESHEFAARPLRFIKVRGLHNTVNSGFHIVEIEAYCLPR